MKKQSFTCCILLIFCISFLTVTAIEAAEKVTWKYNTLHTGSYYHNVLMRELGKEVSERSGGRLEITIHPAGELGYKGTEIVRLLRDNILSISEVIGAFNARNLPVLSVAELPFFSPTYEEARKVADAVRPIINRELEQKFKSKILINFTFDPQQIYCNKRIAKLEDFKGVKIRVWGAEPAELLKAWGAAPVFMSSAEVYTALQHKTVDGAITGYFTCYTFNWPDVVKYCNMWNWAITPSLFVVMNTEAFNRLPKDVQKIVLDAAQKIEEKGWKVAPGVSDELKGKLQAKGMEMVSVPASEREKGAKFAPAVWETWEKHGGPVCSEAMKAALKAIGR